MIQPSLGSVESAVVILGMCTLVLAVVVYLVMEIHHRRQVGRGARRLILASKLFPPLGGEALRAFWRRGRADRQLIEEILVDMCHSPDVGLRAVVERSIIESGIFARWLEELHHRRVGHRVRAALRLGYVHELRGIYGLVRTAEDPSPEVRLAVTLSLGRLKDPRGLPGLLRVAAKPVKGIPDLTLTAALAACAQKSPGGLANLLLSPEARGRIMGAWALSEVADYTVLRYLLAASGDPDPEVRSKVARAFVRVPGQDSADALCRLARDPVWFVRVRALDAVGRLKLLSGEDAVLAGLEDQVREVRYRAAFALRSIDGMKGELAAKIFSSKPPASFQSLVSEWEQAGFIWQVATGLTTRDMPRFFDSKVAVRVLITAGLVRALEHLILVFPDLKVRLRLLGLFLEIPSPKAQSQLLALADQPGCDRRVAATIRRAFPSVEAQPVAGGIS